METDKHGPELNEFKSKSYPFTPKSGKVKICQHFQIPFCKTLKNKLHNVKVLLKRIHLNGQTIRFRQQNQKLEPPYIFKDAIIHSAGCQMWKILCFWSEVVSACKESGVRQPKASGFCYWASEFCFQLAQRARSFLRNSNNRRTVRSILLFKKLLG